MKLVKPCTRYHHVAKFPSNVKISSVRVLAIAAEIDTGLDFSGSGSSGEYLCILCYISYSTQSCNAVQVVPMLRGVCSREIIIVVTAPRIEGD